MHPRGLRLGREREGNRVNDSCRAHGRLVAPRVSFTAGRPQVFLDSDDLADLRNLLDAVAESDVLVLLQTTNLLTRPWCLLEIYTAILNGTPIVTVNVMGTFVYSFDDAWKMLGPSDRSFAEELNARNPGAVDVLRRQRIPVHGVLKVSPRRTPTAVIFRPLAWAGERETGH